MPASVDQIEKSLLKLGVKARARLAHALLASLDPVSDNEAQELWAEEAQRRDDELEARACEERSFDDVMREIRALLQ